MVFPKIHSVNSTPGTIPSALPAVSFKSNERLIETVVIPSCAALGRVSFTEAFPSSLSVALIADTAADALSGSIAINANTAMIMPILNIYFFMFYSFYRCCFLPLSVILGSVDGIVSNTVSLTILCPSRVKALSTRYSSARTCLRLARSACSGLIQ